MIRLHAHSCYPGRDHDWEVWEPMQFRAESQKGSGGFALLASETAAGHQDNWRAAQGDDGSQLTATPASGSAPNALRCSTRAAGSARALSLRAAAGAMHARGTGPANWTGIGLKELGGELGHSMGMGQVGGWMSGCLLDAADRNRYHWHIPRNPHSALAAGPSCAPTRINPGPDPDAPNDSDRRGGGSGRGFAGE